MSESIAKYVKDAYRSLCLSRYKHQSLNNKLQNRHLVLDKEFSIIHVGIYDIHSLSVGEIVSSFNNLVEIVIPRPVDHQVRGDKVKLVNSKLKQLCMERKVQFLHTFRPFYHQL